jgi:hypothetical protein
VTKHLNAQGRLDQGGGSKGRAPLVLAFKQNLNPSYWCIWRTKNRKKGSRFEKVMIPQSRESKTQKNKSLNTTTMVGSQSPKKFFVSCFVVIRVQRLFIKLQVAPGALI